MKKIFLLLIIPLFLTGCSSAEISNNEIKVKDLEQKIVDLQSQLSSTTATTTIMETATTSPTSAIEIITPKPVKKVINNPRPVLKPQEEAPAKPIVKEIVCSANAHNVNGVCYCNTGFVVSGDGINCVMVVNTTTPTPQPSNENNNNNSVVKVAKCEAEKTLATQMFQRVEEAAGQMAYSNLLKELDVADPCGKAFYPDAIRACIDNHASYAKGEAIRITKESHSKNQITIQNNYITCLNK